MIRSTYTYTLLPIPTSAWDAIRDAIRRAESPGNTYDEMFTESGAINMHGVAVIADPELD